jgi:hypothetical protein
LLCALSYLTLSPSTYLWPYGIHYSTLFLLLHNILASFCLEFLGSIPSHSRVSKHQTRGHPGFEQHSSPWVSATSHHPAGIADIEEGVCVIVQHPPDSSPSHAFALVDLQSLSSVQNTQNRIQYAVHSFGRSPLSVSFSVLGSQIDRPVAPGLFLRNPLFLVAYSNRKESGRFLVVPHFRPLSPSIKDCRIWSSVRQNRISLSSRLFSAFPTVLSRPLRGRLSHLQVHSAEDIKTSSHDKQHKGNCSPPAPIRILFPGFASVQDHLESWFHSRVR